MAHFVKIENDTVVDITVIANSVLEDKPFPKSEEIGQKFIKEKLGFEGEWLQTSYNKNFRYNFAGIGHTYDRNFDAFVPPQLYSDWNLNTGSMLWEPPKPYPNDGKDYEWNENTSDWTIVN